MINTQKLRRTNAIKTENKVINKEDKLRDSIEWFRKQSMNYQTTDLK